VNEPDAEITIGDPGTEVAVITVEFSWQIIPETRAVGLPMLSKNEMASVNVWPATMGAGIEAKLLIDANPGDATIVLLIISAPANDTMTTSDPLTETCQGTITEQNDNADGVRKICWFCDTMRRDNGGRGKSHTVLPNLSKNKAENVTWLPTSGESVGKTDTSPETAEGTKSAFT